MADYYAGVDDGPMLFEVRRAQATNTAQNREEPVMSGALPSGYVHDYNIPFKGVHHAVRGNEQFVKIRPLPYFAIQTSNGNGKTVSFQTTVQVHLDDGQTSQAQAEQVQLPQVVTIDAKEPAQPAKQIQNGSANSQAASSRSEKKQKEKAVVVSPVPDPSPPDPRPKSKSPDGSKKSKKGEKKVQLEVPVQVSSSSSSSSASNFNAWQGTGQYDPDKGWKVNETPPSSVESSDKAAKGAKQPSSKNHGKSDKSKDVVDKKRGSDDAKKGPKRSPRHKDGGSPKGSNKDVGSHKNSKEDGGSDKNSKKDGASERGSKKDDGSSKSGKGSSHSSKSKRPPETPYLAMYGQTGPQPPWGAVPPFAGASWPYPQPGPGAQMPYSQPMPGQQMPYPQYMPAGFNPNAPYGPFQAGMAPPPQNPGDDFDFTVPPPPNWAPPGSAERAKLVAEEAELTVQIVADASNQRKATSPSEAQKSSVKEAPPIDVAVVSVDAEGASVKIIHAATPPSKAGSKAVSAHSQESDNHRSVSHSVNSFHTTSSEQRRKVVYLSKDDRYFTLRFNVDELKHLGDDAKSKDGTVKTVPANKESTPSHRPHQKIATKLSPKNLADVGQVPVSELLHKGDGIGGSAKQVSSGSKSKHTQSKSAVPIDSNSSVAGSKKSRESGVDPKPHKIIAQSFDITIHDKRGSKHRSSRSHATRDRSPSVRPKDSISQASSEHHHHSSSKNEEKSPESHTSRNEGRKHAPSTIHPWDSISQVSTSPAQKQRSASKAERGSNAPDQGLSLKVPTVVSNYKSATVESVSSGSSSHGHAAAPSEGVHISIRRVRDDSQPRDMNQRMDGSSSEPDRRSCQSRERDRIYSQYPRSTASSPSDKSGGASSTQRSPSSSHREENQVSHRSASHEAHHSDTSSRHTSRSSRAPSPESISARRHASVSRRRQDDGRDDRVIVRVESRRRVYDEDSADERSRRRESPRQRREDDHREAPNLRRRTFVRVEAHAPRDRAPSQHSRVETIASEDTTARRRGYRRPEWLDR